ncbi:MAG: nucleotide exchange factor GrpE [Clostridia bacterium]|nr:nucleotide exchange factor GrpE [Clostridia bacterium]
MSNKRRRSQRYEEAVEEMNEEMETVQTQAQEEQLENQQPTAEAQSETAEPQTAEAAGDAEPTEAEETAQEAAEEAPELSEQEVALKEALAKQEEYLTLAQRIQADFENFRRRNRNVRAEAFDEGAAAFATTLLPVIDNLERAIAAAQNTTDESLKVGVEMVYRQLCDCFTKRGITVIDRKGEPFDPKLENAVMQGTEEDGEPGTVCEVFQKGYMLGESVLRHAMVKVVPQ